MQQTIEKFNTRNEFSEVLCSVLHLQCSWCFSDRASWIDCIL